MLAPTPRPEPQGNPGEGKPPRLRSSTTVWSGLNAWREAPPSCWQRCGEVYFDDLAGEPESRDPEQGARGGERGTDGRLRQPFPRSSEHRPISTDDVHHRAHDVARPSINRGKRDHGVLGNLVDLGVDVALAHQSA